MRYDNKWLWDKVLKYIPCSESQGWLAKGLSAKQAWETCRRADWMMWLLGRAYSGDMEVLTAMRNSVEECLELMVKSFPQRRQAMLREICKTKERERLTGKNPKQHLARQALVYFDNNCSFPWHGTLLSAAKCCACASARSKQVDHRRCMQMLNTFAKIIRKHITYRMLQEAERSTRDVDG